MDGEEFLRMLASEIVAEVDVGHWWGRYSSAFDALDLVGAVDETVAREIGEGIRTDLGARSGEEIPRFHLSGRRREARQRWPDEIDVGPGLSRFGTRSAWTPLPAAMASGAVDFVAVVDDGCWLVSSGAGTAPWPQPERPTPVVGSGQTVAVRSASPRLAPDWAVFGDVVDDHNRSYRLASGSSGVSSSGAKRHRWDLRLRLTPTPGPEVRWLRFTTPHGPLTAHLRDGTAPTISTDSLPVAASTAEFYLDRQLHDHSWSHLLDPDRPLAGLGVIADALVAVAAVPATHPMVGAVASVDDAIAGGSTAALPTTLATALRRDADLRAWIGCSAVGVAVTGPGGIRLGLEALVGHPDRTALHFVQPAWSDTPSGTPGLVVTATDDRGRGHVAHAEILSSVEEGAFHFRPPLASDARRLTVRLRGPAEVVEVGVDCAASDGDAG